MAGFNYQEWRDNYIAETGASAGQVDYYCIMLMRDSLHAQRQHSTVGAYIGFLGANYNQGASEFKAVEALWEALYGAGQDEQKAAFAGSAKESVETNESRQAESEVFTKKQRKAKPSVLSAESESGQ